MRSFAERVFVAAMVIGAIALTAYGFNWILLLLALQLAAVAGMLTFVPYVGALVSGFRRC